MIAALAVVAHPRRQVFRAHTAPGRPRIPRMPEIMKCRPSAPIARTACGQDACLLKFPRRSGPPLGPGKIRRDLLAVVSLAVARKPARSKVSRWGSEG